MQVLNSLLKEFFIAGSLELLTLNCNDNNLYIDIMEPVIENSKIRQRKERLLFLGSNDVCDFVDR